ncbi:hypothetical protein E4191_22270 (plasmid) [Paracoccus liaowanqingii]|uniref:Uncharacterized protein n=1 Tax=Paracoccus liaowanqingii TaxID=2560053 RepID=A0A4Y5SVB8_9RHOB|nr:hypothetical protein [Paracoccus liaowanqingii]QDA36808.1 hypothetical protein E4191_22270 [Paracoccus liaowanqingii]
MCFWLVVSIVAGTPEPWDAESYWTVAYPISGLLAAIIGFRSEHRGWLVGIILTQAQFPVMLTLAGLGPMSAFGLALLAALAIPVTIVSAAASWIGRRRRQDRYPP